MAVEIELGAAWAYRHGDHPPCRITVERVVTNSGWRFVVFVDETGLFCGGGVCCLHETIFRRLFRLAG